MLQIKFFTMAHTLMYGILGLAGCGCLLVVQGVIILRGLTIFIVDIMDIVRNFKSLTVRSSHNTALIIIELLVTVVLVQLQAAVASWVLILSNNMKKFDHNSRCYQLPWLAALRTWYLYCWRMENKINIPSNHFYEYAIVPQTI